MSTKPPQSKLPKAGKPKSQKAKAKRPQKQQADKDRLVRAPVALSTQRTLQEPKQKMLPNGDIVVEHREFVRPIVSTGTAFQVFQNEVNPGLVGSFSWLSDIANNYESYMFDELEFEYLTAVGSNTDGVVYLAVDYDPSDSTPEDIIQMSSYQPFVRTAPWSDAVHRSPKRALRKRQTYFVRNGTPPATAGLNTYDTGNFFLALNGCAAGNVGELYVKYKVRFMTPQRGSVGVGSALSSLFTYLTSSTASKAGNAPLTVVVATGGGNTTYTFTSQAPYQALLAVEVAVGTVVTAVTAAATTNSQVTNLGAFVSAGQTSGSGDFLVNFRAIGSVVTVTIANTTLTTSTARFGQYNYSLA